MQNYFSNGKLLLTAEYAVMDGATALALPTQYGQSLEVSSIADYKLYWTSFDSDKSIWFDTTFEFKGECIVAEKDCEITKRLIKIFKAAQQLNPHFLNGKQGYAVRTHLQFPRDWGLGTSSTLINNIANWAKIDPYRLLSLTFGGSGYDIACARHNMPITYKLGNKPEVRTLTFNPPFRAQLYFVYLNQKQNSREAISKYRSRSKMNTETIMALDKITAQIIDSSTLTEFMQLIDIHECIIGKLIGQTPIKARLFNDFEGSIKSLGAWGGDFVLAACHSNPIDYFKKKGYHTILPYDKMIL